MSRRSALKATRAAQRREQARRRARRNRYVLAAAAVAVLVAIGVGAALTTGPKPAAVKASGFSFTYLDGRRGSLADFDGKPVVVNFFASWCPTCWEEMGSFQRVWEQSKDRVGFLGLALQETPDGARSIVQKTGVTYPLGADPQGDIFRKLGGKGMPTTVFFDERGKPVRNVTGGLDQEGLRGLIQGLFVDRKTDVAVRNSCEFKDYPIQGRELVTPQGKPGAEQYRGPYAWNSDPPTSGWHDPKPAAWGIHNSAVHPAVLLRNLELGGVAIQYKGLSPGDVDQLATIVRDDPRNLVLAPNPDLPSTLAVSAWGKLMTCATIEPNAVRRFIQSYRDHGPETGQ